MTDIKKFEEAVDSLLEKASKEEIEKYFPEDKTPHGWVDIEEYLPRFYAIDIAQGYSNIKVKFKDGTEGISQVADHNLWYYLAKDSKITHWWNE